MANIEIGEAEFVILDKYCREDVRPCLIGPVVERILREWYMQAAKAWVARPELIPELPKVSEGKTNSVDVSRDVAVSFFRTILFIKGKTGKTLDPASLATWLTKLFIRTWSIKKKSEMRNVMGRVVS